MEGVGPLSLKICTSEYMLSDPNGVGPSRTWYPRIVAERFLESTRDGKIDRAPDPVPMIEEGVIWPAVRSSRLRRLRARSVRTCSRLVPYSLPSQMASNSITCAETRRA